MIMTIISFSLLPVVGYDNNCCCCCWLILITIITKRSLCAVWRKKKKREEKVANNDYDDTNQIWLWPGGLRSRTSEHTSTNWQTNSGALYRGSTEQRTEHHLHTAAPNIDIHSCRNRLLTTECQFELCSVPHSASLIHSFSALGVSGARRCADDFALHRLLFAVKLITTQPNLLCESTVTTTLFPLSFFCKFGFFPLSVSCLLGTYLLPAKLGLSPSGKKCFAAGAGASGAS